MSPEERAARRRLLALDVRRAISELTHDDPLLMTSIPEVARHLGVDDAYLLCEAFEIVAASREIHVASGIVSVTGKHSIGSIKRERERATRLHGVGSRSRAKSRRSRGRSSAPYTHPVDGITSRDRGR
jgi:hypothetical protein